MTGQASENRIELNLSLVKKELDKVKHERDMFKVKSDGMIRDLELDQKEISRLNDKINSIKEFLKDINKDIATHFYENKIPRSDVSLLICVEQIDKKIKQYLLNLWMQEENMK